MHHDEQAVAGRLAKVEAWLRETTEAEWRETCQFDHHGDCQMHGYDAPCPIPAIRDYFEEASITSGCRFGSSLRDDMCHPRRIWPGQEADQ